MKKRIDILLNECTDQKMKKPWPLIDAKKFAELLIRECAMVAEEVDGDYRARKCILEHFGVTE
ncbi:hypothetical protein GW796_08245 [archaeon]|jgi:hypothetical protein|nr:hypothetical protein [archaeon]